MHPLSVAPVKEMVIQVHATNYIDYNCETQIFVREVPFEKKDKKVKKNYFFFFLVILSVIYLIELR